MKKKITMKIGIGTKGHNCRQGTEAKREKQAVTDLLVLPVCVKSFTRASQAQHSVTGTLLHGWDTSVEHRTWAQLIK